MTKYAPQTDSSMKCLSDQQRSDEAPSLENQVATRMLEESATHTSSSNLSRTDDRASVLPDLRLLRYIEKSPLTIEPGKDGNIIRIASGESILIDASGVTFRNRDGKDIPPTMRVEKNGEMTVLYTGKNMEVIVSKPKDNAERITVIMGKSVYDINTTTLQIQELDRRVLKH